MAEDGGKGDSTHVWLPMSPEEYRQMQEERKKWPSVPKFDYRDELRNRRIITLHQTTEHEEGLAEWTAPVSQLSERKRSMLSTIAKLPPLDLLRIVRDENGNEYFLASPASDILINDEKSAPSPIPHILVSPMIRVFPSPGPTYVLALSAYDKPVGESESAIQSSSIDPFVKFTARLVNRDRQEDAESTMPLIGQRLQLAITLPSPLVRIPIGTVVQEVPIGEELGPEAYLLKLEEPIIGPSIGIKPWQTNHLVIAPRFRRHRIRFLFDRETLGPVHVNVFRAVSEERLLSGDAFPNNMIPFAVAMLLTPGAAPEGAVDGMIMFGYPPGTSFEPKKEDEAIEELTDDSQGQIQMTMTEDVQAIHVPEGTSEEDVEKKTGKKMKLYGPGPSGSGKWLYITEDDDRRILLGNARLHWDDPKVLARYAHLAMREDYWAEEEAILLRLLELRPGNYLIMSMLAGAKLGTNKPEEAEKILEKVIADRPQRYYPRFLLGQLRWKQKRFEEAIEQYNGALHANPDYSDAMTSLYFVYKEELGKEKAGLEHILGIGATYTTAHGPLHFLAQIHESDNPEIAVEFARASCERRPTSDSIGELSGLLGKSGRSDDVIALVEHFRGRQDVGLIALNNLATSYELKEDYSRASEAVSVIIETLPVHQRGQFQEWLSALSKKAKAPDQKKGKLGGLLRRER